MRVILIVAKVIDVELAGMRRTREEAIPLSWQRHARKFGLALWSRPLAAVCGRLSPEALQPGLQLLLIWCFEQQQLSKLSGRPGIIFSIKRIKFKQKTLRPLPSQLGRTVGRPWVAKSQRPQVPRQRQAGRAALAALILEQVEFSTVQHCPSPLPSTGLLVLGTAETTLCYVVQNHWTGITQ